MSSSSMDFEIFGTTLDKIEPKGAVTKKNIQRLRKHHERQQKMWKAGKDDNNPYLKGVEAKLDACKAYLAKTLPNNAWDSLWVKWYLEYVSLTGGGNDMASTGDTSTPLTADGVSAVIEQIEGESLAPGLEAEVRAKVVKAWQEAMGN
jgi:hypothetical protein